MLTLYGAKGSGAAAPEAALRIAGQEYRWIEAANWDTGWKHEELQRVNPLAQIPTLVLEDGTVMTESAAILIWLGLRYPSSGLLAAEPAQAIRGLVYIAANCYAAIGVIGIYPRHALVDGTTVTQPEFSFWFSDVGWAVENYGTDPDIDVDNAPQDYVAGRDRQLETALAIALKRIDEVRPSRPTLKDRPRLTPPPLPPRR